MTIGKNVYTVGSCTQGFCNIPVYGYTLLLTSVLNVFAYTVFQIPILILESSTFCKHVSRRCIDAYIDASYTSGGGDIACNLEANNKLLDILAAFPFLLRPSA